MLNITITKTPVIIISGARSGSTVLGEYLANKNNLTYYNEPNMNSIVFDKFISEFNSTDNFVLKIMANMVVSDDYPSIVKNKIFGDSCYKIKLIRNNVYEQIASFYISRNRNTWIYTQYNIHVYQSAVNIIIDYREIIHCIKWIIYQNKILTDLNSDVTVYYEDFPILDSEFKKTPRPKNYDQLIEIISRLYSTRIGDS